MKRKYFGHAGHLIVSKWCQFHITTQVGRRLVSTVGDYFPNEKDTKPTTIGAGKDSYFETMVFRLTKGQCSCGCGSPNVNWSEIDGKRYATAKDANTGHEAFCRKYERRTPTEEGK